MISLSFVKPQSGQLRERHSSMFSTVYPKVRRQARPVAPQRQSFPDKTFFHVADNRNIDFDAFGDAGRVNINVNDFLAFKEFGRNGDDTVVKTRATASTTSAFCMARLASWSAVHTQHAQELAVA